MKIQVSFKLEDVEIKGIWEIEGLIDKIFGVYRNIYRYLSIFERYFGGEALVFILVIVDVDDVQGFISCGLRIDLYYIQV